LALLISVLAYRRAGKSIVFNESRLPEAIKNQIASPKPILERYKSIDVSLMITAQRNANNQLRLILKNNGIVPARDIDVIIGEPIRIIKQEEVITGIHDSVEIKDSALKPRLTMIDARSILPISEVLPGVVFDILAVTTMGFGKICDFPISISWLDDRGTRHFQDEIVTI
jgi:hypothetical protein